MRRLYSAAGHFAYKTSKPRWFSAKSSSTCRPLSHPTSGYLSSPVQSPLRRNLIKQSIRHCSCQRIMCSGDADHPGGGMDITNARVLLPTNVKPIHYYLSLEPDFDKFTYEGTVVIEYVQSRFRATIRRCSSRPGRHGHHSSPLISSMV